MSFAEAVRVSANFPWAFRVASMRLPPSNGNLTAGQVPPPRAPNVHLLDGGIVDNTGLDTVLHLLRSLEALASSGENPLTNRRVALAKRIMSTLKERGVFLIEIDSGAKKRPPKWIERRFPTVFEPGRALSNAGFATALFEKERLSDEELNTLLQLRTEEGGYFRMTFTCNHSEDVMTAWALGPDDKAKVLVQFLIELERNANILVNPDNPFTIGFRRLQRRAALLAERREALQELTAEVLEHPASEPDAVGDWFEEVRSVERELEALAKDTRIKQEQVNADTLNRKWEYGVLQAPADVRERALSTPTGVRR
jgi:hypothetical protein